MYGERLEVERSAVEEGVDLDERDLDIVLAEPQGHRAEAIAHMLADDDDPLVSVELELVDTASGIGKATRE
jgi:hypothetical protein